MQTLRLDVDALEVTTFEMEAEPLAEADNTGDDTRNVRCTACTKCNWTE